MKPIKNFIKKLLKTETVVEYIGIAKDEPKRLKRYKELEAENHKYITLADLDIEEAQAMEICKEHNLLSPKYTNSFRGGCWFCNRQSLIDLWNLWHDYPEYYKKLEDMEIGNFNSFRFQDISLTERRKQFENGFIPKKKGRINQMTIFDIIHHQEDKGE